MAGASLQAHMQRWRRLGLQLQLPGNSASHQHHQAATHDPALPRSLAHLLKLKTIVVRPTAASEAVPSRLPTMAVDTMPIIGSNSTLQGRAGLGRAGLPAGRWMGRDGGRAWQARQSAAAAAAVALLLLLNANYLKRAGTASRKISVS